MQHLQFYVYAFETLLHGLKVCISFGYDPQIIFCDFFHKMNLVIELILGILCMHLLQFYVDSFKTLQMFKSWSVSKDVHIV